MHGIIAMTEDLLEKKLDKQAHEDAVIVRDCAEHLLSLLNDVLDFSRIYYGKFQLEKIPFHLVSEIRKTINIFEANAKAKSITFLSSINILKQHRIGMCLLLNITSSLGEPISLCCF